jgi:hypothetical protein
MANPVWSAVGKKWLPTVPLARHTEAMMVQIAYHEAGATYTQDVT